MVKYFVCAFPKNWLKFNAVELKNWPENAQLHLLHKAATKFVFSVTQSIHQVCFACHTKQPPSLISLSHKATNKFVSLSHKATTKFVFSVTQSIHQICFLCHTKQPPLSLFSFFLLLSRWYDPLQVTGCFNIDNQSIKILNFFFSFHFCYYYIIHSEAVTSQISRNALIKITWFLGWSSHCAAVVISLINTNTLWPGQYSAHKGVN